jgi:hypothetical protein
VQGHSQALAILLGGCLVHHFNRSAERRCLSSL